MKHGNYGPGNTDFKKLQVSKFPLTLWDGVAYGHCGCGATALALITGKNPLKIAEKVKISKSGKRSFSDRFMINFLRKNNFSVFEVNKANISNRNEWSHSILDNNLVLVSLLTQKKEGSWFVLYNNFLFHNFQISKANYLDFLNFPIESMFVLSKRVK